MILALAAILSALGYLWMGYGLERSSFLPLMGGFALLFALYFLMVKMASARHVLGLTAGAILLRLLFIAVIPNLSDDIYRFLWDGYLITNGLNPYLYLPSTVFSEWGNSLTGIDQQLYNQLNSQGYFTIYPPICQAVYGLAAWLFPNSSLGAIVTIRGLILLAEMGTLYVLYKLLWQWGLSPKYLLWYALNPLVIIELSGNLHPEAWMIFFLLLSVYWLSNNRWTWASIPYGLAVGAKLIPLMFLPFLFRRLGFWRTVVFTLLVLGFVGLFFLPFWHPDLLTKIWTSFRLYFQKFEFNAGLYYVIREIGFWAMGYNIIIHTGTVLPLFVVAGLGMMMVAEKRTGWQTLPTRLLYAFALYLFFATIVHPWYITLLIVFVPFVPFRFPVVWSALIPLSYYAYHTTPYRESLWLIAVEYLIVFGVLGVELWKNYNIRGNFSKLKSRFL